MSERDPADESTNGPRVEPLAAFGLGAADESWVDQLRAAESPLPLGRLGPYELEEEVSRGGQGIVYRGRTVGGDPVAVKRLLAGVFATAAARHRFEREVNAVSSLNHPNIVALFDLEFDAGQPLLAMEWIDGCTVTDWASMLEGGRRPPQRIVAMMIKIAEAVHHAHQRGVIHRDLKPSNILVDGHSEPHILDFGLAKCEATDGSAPLTLSGQFLGTPAYSSPEQVRGGLDAINVRSDLYALGVIFFEMLTGEKPYPVDGPLAQTFEHIERTEPKRPSTLAPAVDRELDAIVRKMLAKRQVERYESVAACIADLDRWRTGAPVEAPVDTAFYRLRKTIRRHRAAVSIASAFVLLVIGFGVTMAVLYQRSERQADRALRVQRFLEDTLISTSPFEGGGGLTVLEVLERASGRIAVELHGQPEAEAGVRHTIAQVYAGFWMWSDAHLHARRALDLYREQYHGDHTDVAACMTLLGRACTFLDDPVCVELQSDALAMRRRLYGDRHPMVAETLTALAFAEWQQGPGNPVKLQTAEGHYRDALAMYEETLRTPDADWARALYSFASFSSFRGRYEEAEAHYRRSIEMYRTLEGSGDVYMARCMEGYAALLRKLNRFDEAIAMLEESLALTPDMLQREWTPALLWQLGRLQHRRRDLAATARLYDRSLAMSCRVMAENHPGVSDRMTDLAFRLLGRGADPVDASVYRQVFETMREVEGVRGLELAAGLMDLAVLRLDLGDGYGAAHLLEACLSIRREMLPAGDLLTADAASMLGVLFTQMGEFDKAETLLVPAWRTVRAAVGDGDVRTAVTGGRVVRLYEAWGRTEEAGRYREMVPALPEPGEGSVY